MKQTVNKVLWSIIVACCLVLSTTSASATPEPSPKPSVTFYEFGPTFIEGMLSSPGLTNFHVRERVRFGRLAELKKSFLSALLDSRPPMS